MKIGPISTVTFAHNITDNAPKSEVIVSTVETNG